jgi:hypothetical protein
MKPKYITENKDGKTIYRDLTNCGRPGRILETTDWEIDSYINHCIFPIFNAIMQMGQLDDVDNRDCADILERLYDSAHSQLTKMCEAIYKDIGDVQIISTNEDHKGGFLKQEILEAFVEKKQIDQQSDS